jgi:UDP-N-acetylglucosamine 2-epimerase (non-hydrolysing)
MVRSEVEAVLGGDRRVQITAPLDYPDLVRLLRRSAVVLSDSGGIQEEAPTFGVPVLVLRDRTERIEAIEADCAVLVGTDRARIVAEANRVLSGTPTPSTSELGGWRPNPFGDGDSGERAADAVARLLGLGGQVTHRQARASTPPAPAHDRWAPCPSAPLGR